MKTLSKSASPDNKKSNTMAVENTSSSIRDYYEGTHIFITGGTGLIGKVLIEKLLRSCRGIHSIYVLMRPKKGQSTEQRYNELTKIKLFDRIREEDDKLFTKLVCVSGDISHKLIGLDPLEREHLINNVNVVFHVAATVKFNEPLRDAADLNIFGTQRVMDLCMEMKKLKSVVHVSTAYCNPMRTTVDEIVYPTNPLEWDTFLKCLTAFSGDSISLVADRLQGKHPNTYTLTKSVAESLVADYSHKIPISIVRPSLVGSAYLEPFPGWLDNPYGISGAILAASLGAATNFVVDSGCRMDVIPVDTVSNTIIAAGWANPRLPSSSPIQVYNCTSGQINPITWGKFSKVALEAFRRYPTMCANIYPVVNFWKSGFICKVLNIILHYFPAFFLDSIMRLKGGRPKFVRLVKHAETNFKAGEYFALREWNFDTKNFRALIELVEDTKDGKDFSCSIKEIDWSEYIREHVLGIRQHLLKDDMSTLELAKKKIQRLFWIQKIIEFGALFLLYKLFKIPFSRLRSGPPPHLNN